MKNLILLFSIVSFTCNSVVDPNTESFKRKSNNYEMFNSNTDTLHQLILIDSDGNNSGMIWGDQQRNLIINGGNAVGLSTRGINPGQLTISKEEVFSNIYIRSGKGYKTADGSEGKTVIEEYEDKNGNVHTKVYKNGLLISLKINGAEQN